MSDGTEVEYQSLMEVAQKMGRKITEVSKAYRKGIAGRFGILLQRT